MIVGDSHRLPFSRYGCSLQFNPVRLNLFNILLALFHAKFASNSAFRNPVFRWESCKDSVRESVKKSSRVCNQEEPRDWIL